MTMLIDHYLATFDATAVTSVAVAAAPEVTYRAIRETDIRDPITNILFGIRELPNRLLRRVRGEPAPSPSKGFTFADLATPEMGWVLLGDEAGQEFVVGAVGRFW